jgi:hypothetical protein
VVTDPYVNHRSQLSIEQDQPSIGYFYADQFNFLNSGGNNGYIGLQTHMFTDHDIGKGVVFSIWGATTFDTSGCAAAGCVGVSGVEGTPFLSIRLPFAWVAGVTYEVRMIRGHTGNVLNQRVDATIKDVTHNVTYSAGALNVPTDWGGFNGQTYQWVEEYLPNSYPSCSNILRTAAIWGGVTTMATATSSSLTPTRSTPHIASGPGICTNSATAYLGQGSYRHIVLVAAVGRLGGPLGAGGRPVGLGDLDGGEAQLGAQGVGHDVDLRALRAVVGLPAALVDAAGDDDPVALLEAGGGVLAELGPGDDVDEADVFLPFVVDHVAAVDGDAEVGDRPPAGGEAKLGVTGDVPDERHGAVHVRTPLIGVLVPQNGCGARLVPTVAGGRERGSGGF